MSRPPNPIKTATISLRLPVAELEALRNISVKTDAPVAALIRRGIKLIIEQKASE